MNHYFAGKKGQIEKDEEEKILTILAVDDTKQGCTSWPSVFGILFTK